MSREFKFRVWSFLEKAFYYFTLEEGVPSGIAGGISEPQQYTGLSDDYGNPIYEGDIIKDTWKENHPCGYCPDEEYDREDIFLVKYNDYSFNLKKVYSSQQTLIDQFKRQIIGNIFENPELLK